MKKVFFLIVFVTGASFLTGCATILSGKNRNINVQTQNGKEVKIQAQTKDGIVKLTVPSTLSATASKENIIITVEDPCYKRTQMVVAKKINPTFWVNVLSGGVFGSTTDMGSEAMWTYDENVVLPVVGTGQCK